MNLFLAIAELKDSWPVYALGAATLFYVVVMRPMMKKKKDPLDDKPKVSLAQQRAVEREMSNLLVELSEMARQVTAQLDTRSAKLQALMDDANRLIARLEELTDSEIHVDGVPVYSPRGGPPEIDAYEKLAASGGGVQHEDVYALADGGRSAPEIAQQLSRPRGEVELILALRPK